MIRCTLLGIYFALSVMVIIRGATSQTIGGDPRPICTINQNWEFLFYPQVMFGCWLDKDPYEVQKREAWTKRDHEFLQQSGGLFSPQQNLYFCKPTKTRLGYRPTASVGYFEGSKACTKKEIDEIFSEKKKNGH